MSLPTSASDALVFDFSPQLLRRLMREASVSLGVGGTLYVPHSLRHGGATHDFLRTGSIEHVQFRGRWKSMESSRRYIQQSHALLAAQQVPSNLNQLGALFSDSLVGVIAGLRAAVADVVPRSRSRRVTFRL